MSTTSVLDWAAYGSAYSDFVIATENSHPMAGAVLFMDLILLRVLFVTLIATVCYFLRPFGVTGPIAAGCGALASGAVIVFELRVRALNLSRLIGAVAGSVLGIFGASLFCLVLRSALIRGRRRRRSRCLCCC